MKAQISERRQDRFPAFALFAGVLAAAGLPIYIHAPKFYYDEYGISLTSLASVLFFLRLLDVFQDPVLGRLSSLLHNYRRILVPIAGAIMSLAMLGLFAVPPPISPLIWFAVMLALVFSAFSFLTIVFYAQGVEKTLQSEHVGHVQLATWRETGALAGVCVAAIAPSLLALVSTAAFTLFAVLFFCGTMAAVVAMRKEWNTPIQNRGLSFLNILRDPIARRLLLIAFFNASPVAVTSTLFLFFVESRIEAPGLEGPLLLLFFLAAAIGAPFWGIAAAAFTAKTALLAGMFLSVCAFSFTALLGAGDIWQFALVCVVSGAALGADMTLLPAIFSARIAAFSHNPDQAYGLWSFVSKLALAFAVITVLPLLEISGLTKDQPAPDAALMTLTLVYAVLPCVLKLIAFALMMKMPLNATSTDSLMQSV